MLIYKEDSMYIKAPCVSARTSYFLKSWFKFRYLKSLHYSLKTVFKLFSQLCWELGSLQWTKCSSFMKRSLVKFAVTGHIFSPGVRKLNMSDYLCILGSSARARADTGMTTRQTWRSSHIHHPGCRVLSKYVFTLYLYTHQTSNRRIQRAGVGSIVRIVGTKTFLNENIKRV